MKNRGFTLIELLIALPLFGIVMLLVFTVTLSNMRTVNNVDKNVELQQQAQLIFNFMEEKIIQSTGLIYLEDAKGFEKHKTNDIVLLRKVIFKNLPLDKDFPHRKDSGYIFGLIKDPEFAYYNLKYGVGTVGPATVDVGNYIHSMEVEPIPEDKNFNDADGIVLRINFIFDGYAATYENSFHYRN